MNRSDLEFDQFWNFVSTVMNILSSRNYSLVFWQGFENPSSSYSLIPTLLLLLIVTPCVLVKLYLILYVYFLPVTEQGVRSKVTGIMIGVRYVTHRNWKQISGPFVAWA
jgi:hypothetical protein